MSLATTIAKIPTLAGKTRRGRFYAIEGPTCAQTQESLDKIKGDLEGTVYMNFREKLICEDKRPNATYLYHLAKLHMMQEELEEALKSGKNVICTGYALNARANAYTNDTFDTRKMPIRDAYTRLTTISRYLIVPDHTYVFLPSVEVYAHRIEKEEQLSEDYMFSEYRKEYEAYDAMSTYTENVSLFRGNQISMESDMLKMMCLDTFTEGFEHVKRFIV